MSRFLIAMLVASLVLPALTWAQSNSNTTASTQTGGTPADWVNAARARHQAITNARVNNPRQGLRAGTTDGITAASSNSTSNNSSTTSSLLDLVSQLGGSNSSLSGLLGSLSNGNSTNTATNNLIGGSSNGLTAAQQASLQTLLNMANQSSTTSTPKTSAALSNNQTSTGQTTTSQFGGAIGRLPKIASRSQTSTATTQPSSNPKFLDRFASSMITTVFTALSVGFQSADFIKFLKAQLGTAFFPGLSTTTTTSTTTNNTTGNTTNTGTGSNTNTGTGSNTNTGSTSGTGIENQSPPSNSNTSSSGSIV